MTAATETIITTAAVSPRDIYAYLEAIWISKPASGNHYIAKRSQLEQIALEYYSSERLELASQYMDWEITKMERRLRNMKAINSIVKEILDDETQSQCEICGSYDHNTAKHIANPEEDHR